jgi:prepilin-type processing-associated H-X9-DG protein
MPQITCTHCGQPYDIPTEQWPLYQGRQITCTKCNRPFNVGGPAGAPPVPTPPMAGQAPYGGYTPYPGGAEPKKGMSGGKIALLVCGIVLAVLVVCGGLFGVILFPALNRAREQANRVKCASNLKQIGLAMLLYQNQEVPSGALPNRLDVLIYSPADPSRGADLSGDVFICPSDRRNTRSTATGQQLAADLQSGGHLSYVYFFENKNQKKYNLNSSTTVLMYEPLSDHNNEGAEFLFCDGHVDWYPKKAAAAMINDLEHGINPPSTSSLNAGP